MCHDAPTVNFKCVIDANLVGMDACDRSRAHDEFCNALVVQDQGAFLAVGDKVRPSAVWFDAKCRQIKQALHEALRRAFL